MSATTNPSRVAVVAIGGNSLITDNKSPRCLASVGRRARDDAQRRRHGRGRLDDGVTHGNGPQVGFILRRNELAAHEVHPTPLDLIVADTQGSIGFMLQQTLNNEFPSAQHRPPVHHDHHPGAGRCRRPRLCQPTKPIGGFMDEASAREFEAEGWQVVEDAGRGWRRVVASPEPRGHRRAAAIDQAVKMGWIVVAVGGGGIPVVRNPRANCAPSTPSSTKIAPAACWPAQDRRRSLSDQHGGGAGGAHFGKPNQRLNSTR
jgi:carbamate kinase